MNVEELVSALTLEEKAGLCSGADFWHTKAVERLASRLSRSAMAPTACAPKKKAAPTPTMPLRPCASPQGARRQHPSIRL